MVVVPVINVSRLTQHALSEAISLGDEVMAVTVVFDGEIVGLPDYQRGGASGANGIRGWNCGSCTPTTPRSSSPSSVWSTSSGQSDDRQVVVLIPVVVPDRVRYRLLHNQVDLALAAELRRRPDVVVARVALPIHAR